MNFSRGNHFLGRDSNLALSVEDYRYDKLLAGTPYNNIVMVPDSTRVHFRRSYCTK